MIHLILLAGFCYFFELLAFVTGSARKSILKGARKAPTRASWPALVNLGEQKKDRHGDIGSAVYRGLAARGGM
jgi:hypothetical protein